MLEKVLSTFKQGISLSISFLHHPRMQQLLLLLLFLSSHLPGKMPILRHSKPNFVSCRLVIIAGPATGLAWPLSCSLRCAAESLFSHAHGSAPKRAPAPIHPPSFFSFRWWRCWWFGLGGKPSLDKEAEKVSEVPSGGGSARGGRRKGGILGI